MEKDILELIEKLFEIYDEERTFNEGNLNDDDMIFIIEMLLKIWKVKGKI